MLFELILGLITFLFIWDYLNKKRRKEVLRKSNIHGLKEYPIIGCALELKGVNLENIFEFNRTNKQKYGKIYHLCVLHQINVFIADVKYAEAILSSQQIIKKSALYDLVQAWLGTGLLLSEGKKWHTRRKIITPTFHFKILEQFVEIFDNQSAVLVKKLYDKADGKTAINIVPIICLFALDVIAETAMGVKVHAQETPDIEYVKALTELTDIMAARFINPLQRTDWLFQLTSPFEARKMRACIKIMHEFTNKVIEDRRTALEESIKDGTYQTMSNDVGQKKRMALLDVLLQSTVEGNPLSNEDIREEVDTFMFEGHDTTTSGISFCLYLIARHPEVQNTLVKEIKQVIGDDQNKAVRLRDLQELKYMECVIKESLRLYPSVPGIGRQTVEDVVLDDVTIPANTNISLHFYMMLRDPEHFPNPDVFMPERFNSDSGTKINPFAYTPFSAGPRNCIGQKFAMLEMKSTISKLLRHFELLPYGPEVRLKISLVLRSVNGVHIGLKRRE